MAPARALRSNGGKRGREKIRVGTAGTTVPPVESLLRNVRRTEEKGYHSLWWPDHLMGWHPEQAWTPDAARLMPNPHTFLDLVAAMAAAAVHTERILLGSAVTEPVRRHPAMLAQEFLTLDHLSRGRVVMGIGAGEGENLEPYGLDTSHPVARLEEALAIIRLLWEHDEPVSWEGDFWRLRDAVCGMGPYQVGEYPPIWVAAHGPRMLRMVGRRCDGWLPTYRGLSSWQQGLSEIGRAARRAGRDPADITPALWALLVLDEDPAEVERLLEAPLVRGWMLILPASAFEELGHPHPLGEGTYGLRDYIPTRLSGPEAQAAFQAVPPEVCHRYTLSGTPDQVLDELRQFAEAGLEHVILWNITYMADLAKLRPSFALQDELLEALRD
ncbi:MAG: LLM class flavin-dependent oxidoreductase [Actinomycetota bacterium]|nr:LLM class flavin-dependent oxidoreductase [Actinomycetota bacterium]